MKKKAVRSALLLLDVINPFDFEGAAKLAPRAIRAARHIAELKARASERGIPCLYVNDNFGNWTSEFSALTRRCQRKEGASTTLASLLAPGARDLSVLKPRHSAFYGTPLEFLLEELKVSRLILTGIAVDMCVVATAQDAYMRKFDLWVPCDCVAAESLSREKASLAHMALTMKADVRPAKGGRLL